MAHQAPAAQTGAATAVDTASATLAGVVDPNGSDTWYFFRYGVDRYDARTPIARAGDGDDPVAVSAHIEGLSPAHDLPRAPRRLQPPRLRGRRRRPLHDGRPGRGPAPAGGARAAGRTAAAPAPTPSVRGQPAAARPRRERQRRRAHGDGHRQGAGLRGATCRSRTSPRFRWASILDTREGSITLRSALPNGKTQAAIFHGGLFEVRQPQGAGGVTELVLRGALTGCHEGRRTRRGDEQEEAQAAAPAVGPRQQGQLPHPRRQQRRHRARHRLVRRGPLRRHADARQQGQRVGLRPWPPPHRPGARRPQLSRARHTLGR